jgi:multisubunit Na+/H+ antiporter MnhB subunit
MNLMLHLILCAVLIAIVVALLLYQRWLENHSDHYIHLHGDTHDASVVNAQTVQAKRLETVGKVKNGLIVALILYLLAIGGIAAYTAWNNTGT